MNTPQLIIDLNGQLSNLSKRPYLAIKWHRYGDSVYCHSAKLCLKNLKGLNQIKVTVAIKEFSYTDPKNPTTITRTVCCYFPVSSDGLENGICLNSTAIIEALEINSWTKNKNGNKPKTYPVEISFGEEPFATHFKFNEDPLLTPYTLCESLINGLRDNAKASAHILLTPLHQNNTLFDLSDEQAL